MIRQLEYQSGHNKERLHSTFGSFGDGRQRRRSPAEKTQCDLPTTGFSNAHDIALRYNSQDTSPLVVQGGKIIITCPTNGAINGPTKKRTTIISNEEAHFGPTHSGDGRRTALYGSRHTFGVKLFCPHSYKACIRITTRNFSVNFGSLKIL